MPIPEKRKVKVNVAELSVWDLSGRATNCIETLQALVEKHGSSVQLDYGQHNRYDDSYSYKVFAERDETDKELATRLQAETNEQKRRHQLALHHLQTQAAALGFDLTPKP